jgi:hypothetical protein
MENEGPFSPEDCFTEQENSEFLEALDHYGSELPSAIGTPEVQQPTPSGLSRRQLLIRFGIGAVLTPPALHLIGPAFGFTWLRDFVNRLSAYSRSNLQDVLLNLASHPGIAGEQVLSAYYDREMKLERLLINKDPEKNLAYLSVPWSAVNFSRDPNALENYLTPITTPDKIAVAKDQKGILWASSDNPVRLDDLSYRGEDRAFVRISQEDFTVNGEKKLSYTFKSVKYEISLRELTDFLDGRTTYGGVDLFSSTGMSFFGSKIVNHGSMVARPEEPSLMRLCDQLLQKDQTTTPLQLAQSALDFVSGEIPYNFAEANRGGETLKRPNETIMSAEKGSDCSNSAILLASLLEQLKVPYALRYTDRKGIGGHISVWVEAPGETSNGYHFRFKDKLYTLAEGTCPGFQIGKTLLSSDPQKNLRFDLLQFVSQGVIIDRKTGRKQNVSERLINWNAF